MEFSESRAYREIIDLNAYFRKEERSKVNSLNFYLRKWKESDINIKQAEENKYYNRKQCNWKQENNRQINETKCWLYAKINNTGKLLASITRKKEIRQRLL